MIESSPLPPSRGRAPHEPDGPPVGPLIRPVCRMTTQEGSSSAPGWDPELTLLAQDSNFDPRESSSNGESLQGTGDRHRADAAGAGLVSGPETSAGPPDDPLERLVARIASGDEAALAELYDNSNPRVHGLAMHILKDRELAEEATIDVYTQIWRTAGRYDADRGSVLAWILNLTRTRAIDTLRLRARQAGREVGGELLTLIADPGVCPEQSSRDLERGRKLRLALAELPIEQRRAIETAYFKGLSHSEVAAELGQPLGTVKTRIRDGLSALRRSMAADLEGLA